MARLRPEAQHVSLVAPWPLASSYDLVGGTTAVKESAPNCARCGHPNDEHGLIEAGWPQVDANGNQWPTFYHLGHCAICDCHSYDPDTHPLVAELIGIEAKRGIEKAVYG